MRIRTRGLWIAGVVLTITRVAAAQGGPVSVDELVRGADRVVVATVGDLQTRWEANDHGDRLIVSRVELQVEETLKGEAAATVWMDVAGGTLDGLTLQTSDFPLLKPGERAVVFLEPGLGRVHRPFQRGRGILALDDRDLVRGTSLHLNEIRARAGALAGREEALRFAPSAGVLVEGYVLSGHRWASTQVSYYVNPSSKYLSANAAVAAVQEAAAGWNEQTQANIELVYAGTTNGSSVILNNKNEVFYRNSSDGSSVGSTHTWWDSSNRLLESDIVFYEGSHRFYYASGCSAQGVYAEDVAIHELGHLLGLSHSGVSGATMQSVMPGYCDRTQLTLEQDDINGLEAIYPPVNSTSKPTAPSQLNVNASTTSPTSSLVLSWVDNASNESGFRIERSTGSGFQQVAQVGSNVRTYTNTGLTSGTTYTYRVAAYNSGGSSAYSNTDSGQTATSTSNTAPAVTVANPVNGASYPQGATISFSGSATDTQDGNLTSGLRWVSNVSGQIGTGASFSRTLPAGSHTITASVTDGGGMSGQHQVTMMVAAAAPAPTPQPSPTPSPTPSPGPAPTPSPTPSPGPAPPQNPEPTSNPAPTPSATLLVVALQIKGLNHAELIWTGLSATSVDIYRNDTFITTLATDSGPMVDALHSREHGTVRYRVCVAGTTICTNEATATF